MPGILRCGALDITSPKIVENVFNAVKRIANNRSNKYKLQTDGFSFNIAGGDISTEPGWYIICVDGNIPIYVGKANNLNYRLNTDEGSLDRFAERQRKTDSERNFIKALLKNHVIKNLYVVIIGISELNEYLKMKNPLNEIDMGNIEKFINIHRGLIFKND
jgi:hypothetical protein